MQCRRPRLIPGSGRSTGERIGYPPQYSWASIVAQLVKNLPAMQETWVQSLGWEDPRRRERLPTPVFWPGESHGLYSARGGKESDTTERLFLSQPLASSEHLCEDSESESHSVMSDSLRLHGL